MTRSNRIWALLLATSLAVGSTTSTIARVADAATPADMETARELYKAGRKLRDAGDLQGALEKFKAAHALAGTPITGVELGKTHLALAQLVEAREAFLEVGRMPVDAKESENAKAARAEAAKLAAEVAPKIPSIALKINGVPPGAQPIVTVDGAPIPAAAIGEPRKVNPGKHVVAARIGDGEVTTIEVEVKEGETKPAEMEVKPPRPNALPFPETNSTVPLTAPPPSGASNGGGPSPLVWVGFGVAGIGLVAGSVTGVLALSKSSSVKNACVQKDCPPSAQSDIDASKSMGTISTVSFVVGGIGAAVGVAALLIGQGKSEAPKSASAPHVSPWFGGTSMGVEGAF